MRRRALRTLAASAVLSFAALSVLPAAPALAVQDEPTILVTAWYWEDQQRQRIQDPTTGTDVAVIQAPNPFCPSPPLAGSPPEDVCKPGRLPVQVRDGDYETPNQLSAVGFDLALVPPGSKIGKFTVTFVEAKDDQSAPLNAEGKSLQACFIDEFFGDGEASLYREVPKYTCSEGDPIAKRKEIKVKEEGGGGGNDPQAPEQQEPTFGYTFDLTEFARTWVSEGTPMTAIMLMPVRPLEAVASRTAGSRLRSPTRRRRRRRRRPLRRRPRIPLRHSTRRPRRRRAAGAFRRRATPAPATSAHRPPTPVTPPIRRPTSRRARPRPRRTSCRRVGPATSGSASSPGSSGCRWSARSCSRRRRGSAPMACWLRSDD